jgi:hypothetical protein
VFPFTLLWRKIPRLSGSCAQCCAALLKASILAIVPV